MSRFLMIDIGAGTMDILVYDTRVDMHYKAVVKSPVRYVAEKAAAISGNLLVVGNEMGGGPITQILMERARGAEVVMSLSASATLNHDVEKVKSWGIKVVEDDRADAMGNDQDYTAVTLSDLEPARIEQIVKSFGVDYIFDAVAVCAQDHGVPEPGISHLDFRHNMFAARLNREPYPHTLLYPSDRVPDTMNRLKSIARSAQQLPAAEIFVMDSGMAAILGASLDGKCRRKKCFLVLDIATSHTVGAAMDGEALAGFFEYHTSDITLEKLEDLLRDLADGKLSHQQILSEGGHGAFLRRAVSFSAVETIVATGPRRKMLAQSRLPIEFGAPWGDNMMTGTVGLLEAVRRQKGLDPILYL
ncbi:MAG: pyruvate formate-lyase activating enzyme [Deltaproteobacteria bacterium]|nr:pyruvate formate-lyase activating enzyme [Deltaproteobacteria bacterium]